MQPEDSERILFRKQCLGMAKRVRILFRKGGFMANIISDETIEYVGILAKLSLSEEEREQARKDMGRMLDYIDKLNELDTTGVEPMSHAFPVENVFREDEVTGGDGSKDMLRNAPARKGDMFAVPNVMSH